MLIVNDRICGSNNETFFAAQLKSSCGDECTFKKEKKQVKKLFCNILLQELTSRLVRFNNESSFDLLR